MGKVKSNIFVKLIVAAMIFACFLFMRANIASADIASGTNGTCSWVISDEGVLTISPTDGVEGTLGTPSGNGPFYSYRNQITKVIVTDTVKTENICSTLFYGLQNCTEMDLSGLDTSNAKVMSNMFSYCRTLTSLNLGDKFDTSNVEDMSQMFSYCQVITSLDLGDNFDTSNVYGMHNMFKGCYALASLDLGDKFDTSKVTDMSSMFYTCRALTSLDLGDNFDTSKVIDMSDMFNGCSALTSLNLGDKFYTSNVTNMSSMFYNCTALESLDLGDKFDTSNVTTMYNMFYSCESLGSLDLGDNFYTSSVTSMYGMFGRCRTLTSLDLGDKFDTSNVTTMYNMFYSCESLGSLDLGENFDTSNVTKMNSMFQYCQALTSLDLGDKFDTSNVTSMRYMFHNCVSLTSLDLEDKFDTSNVTTMASMFCNCESLASLDLGDSFNTSNVEDMSSMFEECGTLTSLDLGDNFDTSNVTTMVSMFYNCKSLTALDLGDNFDTLNVSNMKDMFDGCHALAILDLGDKFDTSNVTSMYNMFFSCKALQSIDLGDKFDTSNVIDMSSMFSHCISLKTIDLGDKFDTSNVTRMPYMFSTCSSFTSINLGDKFDTSNVTDMNYMFNYDDKLSSIILSPEFVFVGSDSSLPTPPSATTTGKWIRSDESHGPYTPAELRDNYTPDMAGEWVWQERATKYTITFTSSEPDALGSMPDVKPQAGEAYTLPANAFRKHRYSFVHWDDGNGHTYDDEGTIPANTYEVGDEITLTAVLEINGNSVHMEDGQFYIDVYGNEKVSFDGIPAGTAYQVYEETPNGWVLIEQSNTSGTIAPLEEANASFTNQYQPGIATVQFSGTKTLDDKAVSAGAFSFSLKENNVELDNKQTMDGGFFQFDVITYTNSDVGIHTYTIEEVNPNNDKLIWDKHKETVTVNVREEGSEIIADVTYDTDGIIFKNYTKPGILKITKQTEGQTTANEDDVFTFDIGLTNESGRPIDENLHWYTEDNI